MDKQAFIISDLHIGGGAADANLEDFDQDESFVGFVDAIAGADTTLIVNGDFIDFIQIPPYTVPQPCHLLWTEQQSLQKLETALIAHPECFAALKRFVAANGQLRIIIGNHDLDLAWEGVQRRLREVLGAQPHGPVEFVIGHDSYEGVWIEHGHEFTAENCPVDPANFIHDWAATGERYLERVWGTDFVLRFYNDLERSHPYADSVKPTIKALYYGLKMGWVGGEEFCRLGLFLKARGLPWGAIGAAVLDETSGPVSAASLVMDLDDTGWQEMLSERLSDSDFKQQFDAAVSALPAGEKELLAQSRNIAVADTESEDLTSDESAATLGIFRAPRETRAAKDRLGKPGVTHVVFGHSHVVVNGGVEGRLFNPGTWIPRLNLDSPEVSLKIKRQGGLTLDMLDDQKLYVCDRIAVHAIADPKNQAKVRMVEVPSFNEWRS
jgi:UDP-2,3-diacylglucosamine pyrophosphatase LpxH